GHIKIENGRKRIIRRERRNWKDWDVLIKDHHEGYISWDEFERNQRLIADNANRRSNMGRGSIRGGEALLPGLLRCARCGRKLKVAYSGKGGPTQRYVCRGASDDMAASTCITFGGVRVDRAAAQEVLDRLQPLGIEAALAAMNNYGEERVEKKKQLENALEHAEAARKRSAALGRLAAVSNFALPPAASARRRPGSRASPPRIEPRSMLLLRLALSTIRHRFRSNSSREIYPS